MPPPPDPHFHHMHHPDGGGGPFWAFPIFPLLLLATLLTTLYMLRDGGGAAAIMGRLRPRRGTGPAARWRAAADRHRAIAASFAAYECDPQAVLRRPALADVRQPATARFVEAFAEACALATDRYPGREMGDRFVAAADRSAKAWAAASEAADRLGAVQFAPGERTLLEQVVSLLGLARGTAHDGERRLAYERAGQRLADLERTCGWSLPRPAQAVLAHEARRGLTAAA